MKKRMAVPPKRRRLPALSGRSSLLRSQPSLSQAKGRSKEAVLSYFGLQDLKMKEFMKEV